MNICQPVQIDSTAKNVLMALANRSDDQGVCWPGIPDLCSTTCYSRTAVIEAVKRLAADVLVVIEKSHGRSNRFEIQLDTIAEKWPAKKRGGEATEKAEGPAQPVRQTNGYATHTGTPAGPVRQPDSTSPPDAPPPVRQPDLPVRQPDPNHKEPTEEPSKNRKAKVAKPLNNIRDNMLPEWLPADAWQSYVGMRVSIKSPMTINAQQMLIAKLGRFHAEGHNVRDLIEEAVVGNWKSVYIPTQDSKRGGPGNAGAKSDLGDLFRRGAA